MTSPIHPTCIDMDLTELASFEGRVVAFASSEGVLDQHARKVSRTSKGAVERYVASEAFGKLKAGQSGTLSYPAGMVAEAIQVVKLDKRPTVAEARKAGVSIGKAHGSADTLVVAGSMNRLGEIALGMQLRAYSFGDHKTDETPEQGAMTIQHTKAAEQSDALAQSNAVAEGVFFTRDLVSEPANVLTTTEFAVRLEGLRDLGVEVEVLEEAQLEELGMRTLLSVGQGSASPSKVVVMQWNGGGDENPFALIGKGVVFDTGGISLKPAGGMEDMTMDMGGAGVVAGAMHTLAKRKAKANVVGLVGLVENMPSSTATRPGDVVRSMKGDTVEIINTDAEGRLVLADVLWYAQERFEPTGMVDLATLTGAIIVGLGHDNAGVFSNDDDLSKTFLKAAEAEGEGAWRMPMGDSYDAQIKSNIADMKNVGTRAGGSITAAQFLLRFVKDGVPWIHLDIAGVASVKSETKYSPKGATGWGVMALNRMIADAYEVE